MMERTGIEPVTSGLQIPDNSVELGQIRSIKGKLCWLREVENGYSGTRFGTRFDVMSSNAEFDCSGATKNLGALVTVRAATIDHKEPGLGRTFHLDRRGLTPDPGVEDGSATEAVPSTRVR